MSAEEGHDNPATSTEGNIGANLVMEALDEEINSPSKSALDGDGDQQLHSKPTLDDPHNSNNELSEGSSLTPTEIVEKSNGDHKKDSTDLKDHQSSQYETELASKTNITEDSNILSNVEIEIPDKPTLLQTTNLQTNDDSENLDEEVILRYYEEDDEYLNNQMESKDQSDENSKLVTKPEMATVPSPAVNAEPTSSSEDDDLLSEIDAQIAALDANLSKNESENADNSSDLQTQSKCEVDGKVNTEEIKSLLPAVSSLDNEQNTVESIQSRKNVQDNNKEENALDKDSIEEAAEKESSTDILAEATHNTENSLELDQISLEPKSVEINTEMEDDNKNDSFGHDSSGSIEIKPHGVNQPNVMLEIPTQELIDLDESLSVPQEMSMQVDDDINKTMTSVGGEKIQHENEKVQDLVDRQKLNGSLDKQEFVEFMETDENSKIDNKDSAEVMETDEVLLKNQSVDKVAGDTVHQIQEKPENSTTLTLEDSKTDQVLNTDNLLSKNEANLEEKSLLKNPEKSNVNVNQTTEEKSEQLISSNLNLPENIEIIQPSLETSEDTDKDKKQISPEDNSTSIDKTVSKNDSTTVDVKLNVDEDKSIAKEDLSKPEESKVDGDSKDSTKEDDTAKEIVPAENEVLEDVQPSTSQMALQAEPTSNDATEMSEVTDSLGLLAESSRQREDDEADGDDQETSGHEEDDDDDNDDADFEPDDESSNQLTGEHSEDSTPNSEPDLPNTPIMDTEKETENAQDFVDKLTENDKDFDMEETADQGTEDASTVKVAEPAEVSEGDGGEKKAPEEYAFAISNVVSDKEDMDILDDIVCEEVEVGTPADQPAEEQEAVDTTALKKIVEVEGEEKKEIPFKVRTESRLRALLTNEDSKDGTVKTEPASPAKKKLTIAQPSHVVSIVDLDDSEDETQDAQPDDSETEVTSVNISKEIDVMSSGDNTSHITTKKGETVITVPKHVTANKTTPRLNTSEITIKTTTVPERFVIPEAKMGEDSAETTASKFGDLEVFTVDSDDEDTSVPVREPTPEPEKPPKKCINAMCDSDPGVTYYSADVATANYYDCRKKKRAMVCETCLADVLLRQQKLVDGIKNMTPILDIEAARKCQELVEISDSESDEDGTDGDTPVKIGSDKAIELERQLTEMLNTSWVKLDMDVRLREAKDELMMELDRLEKGSEEVKQLIEECQLSTDKLRNELYDTFRAERDSVPAIVIHDTPDKFYICPETAGIEVPNKRRLSPSSESQAKKPAIPMGYTPIEPDKQEDKLATTQPTTETAKNGDKKEPAIDTSAPVDSSKIDDDKDISVVTLSAESAPADLPPCGDAVRPPLQVGQEVFAMRHAFGSWIKATVLDVQPKGAHNPAQTFTMCRVKFDNKTSRNAYKLLSARCLAYSEPAQVRMTIGTRVIALFKDTSTDKSGKRESFYSGVVAEVPNPVNNYRYLVFFDDGYAQYVTHADTRLVCEFSALVWEEVHPFSRQFVQEYLMAYPERPMVRLHTGQSLKTEWNGKWWVSRVVAVDASLVQVYFEQDKRTEWIYRGSTRLAPLYLELQAAGKHRARPLPRRATNKVNMPYVEYTRYDDNKQQPAVPMQQAKAAEEARRQRAVAKKSTTLPEPPRPPPSTGNLDAVTSRVVYYTPKNAVRPHKMVSHTCGPRCTRADVLALKDLRTYNPLAKPLLSGWERQIVRFKGHKEVMYRAPCGRRLRNMAELHRYLRVINSDMSVDLFDFGPNTHCLAEFVLNKCIVGKKDLSHGKENVPVPCVNYYDNSLPEFCSYNTERTPTDGVPLNLDPDFLCGCDCTDDCQDKSKCACWKMTLEGARTIGLDGPVGYEYKRLLEPLPSGIYECNSRCKCKSTCLNRVAQHPLQLKLQVFKTLNRGWGIRALNDVPKGCFLCVYAGNLLTDATANLDGLNEGDEYLAELDYIEVVEQMKEGYEDDIPEQDKKLDKKDSNEEESTETESEEEATRSKSDASDGDFEPGFIPGFAGEFNKRLRKRDKKKHKEKEKENSKPEGEKEKTDEDCITISDDEELREPLRFAAQAGMGSNYVSKYRSVRSYFGKDEACYIMDAKVQGNIGRYLNHSCSPNVFVQNVFVDTHDPRFPWVAFFALNHIRAGTELTWNYNYDVGSVPGKALYCYCGAPNCRGRLL